MSQTPAVWQYINHCSPVHTSLSTACFPQSAGVRAKMGGGPTYMVTQPMAELGQPLPTVNFGSVGVVRCNICRGYMNPYVTWLDKGANWRCNLCRVTNEVPNGYFAPVDPQTGIRSDINERVELKNASFEIIAPAEYMRRPPQPCVYVFVIDVSSNSVASGYLSSICKTIKSALSSLPGGARTQVAFVTFDSQVHYYCLKSTLKSPQMMVTPDLEDLFLPALAEELLVPVSESRSLIDSLLDSLPSMYANTNNVESAFGPAFDAALLLSQHIGGKVLCFLAGLPTLGAGALRNREDMKLVDTEKEQVLLSPIDDFYKKKAIRATFLQISVDLFLSSSDSYLDVASLASLARFSGGQCYYYKEFRVGGEMEKKFQQELVRNLTRTTGWESVMRLRASKGMNQREGETGIEREEGRKDEGKKAGRETETRNKQT